MKKAQKRNIAIVSIILAVILFVAMIGWCTNGFKDWTITKIKEKADDIIAVDENGNNMTDKGTYPLPKNIVFTPMSTMTGSVTVTATLTPSTAANQKVDWAVAWVNASSSWASGKTVTSYATVTTSSDGALTATVNCLQAFGEQIQVTVTSRDNIDVTANCTLDYAMRRTISSMTYTATNTDYNFVFDSTTNKILLPVISAIGFDTMVHTKKTNYIDNNVYTVENESLSFSMKIKASAELITALTAQGLTSDCADWLQMNDGYNEYKDIIYALGGRSALRESLGLDYYQLNITKYNKLLTAFSNTSSIDFYLQLATTFKYGGQSIAEFSYHFDHNSVGLAVSGVALSGNVIV